MGKQNVKEPASSGQGRPASAGGAAACPVAGEGALAGLLRLAIGWVGKAVAAGRRARLRRQALRDLQALNDHLLSDVGLSRSLLLAVANGASGQGRCPLRGAGGPAGRARPRSDRVPSARAVPSGVCAFPSVRPGELGTSREVLSGCRGTAGPRHGAADCAPSCRAA